MVKAELSASVEPAEVDKFSRLAAEWWDPHGKLAVLHKFNPLRLAYIREQVTARFSRDPFTRQPYVGIDFLDIGCGGGLLSEPIARLGGNVTGIDPSAENIRIAARHAEEQLLAIDYRVATAERLSAESRLFDVILNMEVVEHVRDPAEFIGLCGSMLKPDGLMVTATINRTFKSFALAIIGAEYILSWLPRGTHHWESFITPEELGSHLKAAGLKPVDTVGVVYNPFSGEWQRSGDTDVNYMMVASRPREGAETA